MGISWPVAWGKPSKPPVRKTVKMPLVPNSSNQLLVAATINEKTSAKFMFDTGCPFTLISASLAAKLQVQPDPAYPGLTWAINGYPGAFITRLARLEMGNLKFDGPQAAVGDDRMFKFDSEHDIGSDGFFGMRELRALKMAVAVYPRAANLTFFYPGDLQAAECKAAGFGPHALEVPLVWEEKSGA